MIEQRQDINGQKLAHVLAVQIKSAGNLHVDQSTQHCSTERKNDGQVAADPLADQHQIARYRIGQQYLQGALLFFSADGIEHEQQGQQAGDDGDHVNEIRSLKNLKQQVGTQPLIVAEDLESVSSRNPRGQFAVETSGQQTQLLRWPDPGEIGASYFLVLLLRVRHVGQSVDLFPQLTGAGRVLRHAHPVFVAHQNDREQDQTDKQRIGGQESETQNVVEDLFADDEQQLGHPGIRSSEATEEPRSISFCLSDSVNIQKSIDGKKQPFSFVQPQSSGGYLGCRALRT